MHAFDRQTDGQTELSLDRVCIPLRAVKTDTKMTSYYRVCAASLGNNFVP